MSSPHLLIVEDNLDGQEVLYLLLESLGMTSDYVGDAETALKALGLRPYDGVIIDLALPRMDGMALLHRIRHTASIADIPCMAVTAFDNNKLKQDAFEAGFKAYVTKPIDEILLQESVDRLLA